MELNVPQGEFKRATAKSNEGINIQSKNAVVTHREPTVQAMLKLLWKYHLLFVKGPPFSGKTSLASLITQSLVKDPKIDTISISCSAAPDEDDFDFNKFWEEESGGTWDETLQVIDNRRTVLILDVVQFTYTLGRESPLWTLVKNLLLGKYSHIALLMFGTHGGGLQEFEQLATPVRIPDEYVMLLTPQGDKPGLLATDEEFRELIDRHERKYNFQIGDEPRKYIKHITALHLGFVKYILKFIKRNVANQDAQPIERDKNIMLVLRTKKIYWRIRNNSRSIPVVERMDPDMLYAMDIVLHEGKVATNEVRLQAATTLVKRGNLYATPDGFLHFPSPVHEQVYFVDRHQGNRGEVVITDFKEFLIEAVRRMNPNNLRSLSSRDATGHLLIRHWQMEFYRTATSILPPNNFVSPYLSPRNVTSATTEGYLDFYITDQLQWGIVLLREGTDYAKLTRGDVYESILNNLKHLAIIDFRSADKRIHEFDGDIQTCHVSYIDNFEKAIFKWRNTNEQLEIELIGGKIK